MAVGEHTWIQEADQVIAVSQPTTADPPLLRLVKQIGGTQSVLLHGWSKWRWTRTFQMFQNPRSKYCPTSMPTLSWFFYTFFSKIDGAFGPRDGVYVFSHRTGLATNIELD